MSRLLLALTFALATACASTADQGTNLPAPPSNGFDEKTYPTLLEAIQRQRPFLLSGRGGRPPQVVVNGGPPEPIAHLAQIPTKWVRKVERVEADVLRVGNATTLRVTLR